MATHKEPASYNAGPVGPNILHVRRHLRMTQKQLAEPEYSISYISAIERGRIRPSLRALDILARRLGITSAELLATPFGNFAPEGGYSPDGEAAPPLSLSALLSQRPPPYFAALTLSWASINLFQGNVQRARELLDLLSPNAITAEQRLLRLFFLGGICLAEGRPADAQAILEPVFQQDEFNIHVQLLVRCRFTLARAYEAQDKFLPAFDAFSVCVQAIEKGLVVEPLFAIHLYSALAEHHHRLGRRDLAVHLYQQALNRFEFVFNLATLAESAAQLSRHHLENVHSTLAEWHAARSSALFELVDTRQRFTQAAANLGLTLQELGNPQAAEEQLLQAIDLSEQLGTNSQGILTRLDLADLLLERHQALEAERLALEAQQHCRRDEQGQIEDEILYGRVLITLADANKALHRIDEAEQAFHQAIELLKNHQANEYLSQAYFRYSTLLHDQGQDAESYEMVTQAYLLSSRKSDVGIFSR